MQIVITEEHIEFLRENKIFLNIAGTYDEKSWLHPGLKYNAAGKAMVEPYSAVYGAGRLSAVGAFSYTKSYLPPDFFTIGRYCAIAEKSSVIPSNHPTTRLSMCGFDYSRTAPYTQFEADKSATVRKIAPRINVGTTVIGNDVWIGQEVMIKRGVTIGHGAIIGARSIITKDIPPYSLVVGASIIKKLRFPEVIVERLLKSQWWEYSYDQFKGMDTTDPYEFLPAFEYARDAGRLTPYIEKRVDVHAAFRAISLKTGQKEAAE